MDLIERCEAAWAEVDRLRATTVDREHFDRKIREWIALYDEEQAKRRAVERQLAGAVEAISAHKAAKLGGEGAQTSDWALWEAVGLTDGRGHQK